jgi:S-adenosylmethionine/arginine decarboxylase-like enzyme
MKPFGWELNIDLYNCELEKINNKENMEQYLKELCGNILKVRREGDPVLKRYGKEHLQGYSIMQLIEVSSIIAHFSEERCSAHIDIFSCAPFDKIAVENFSKEFFKAKKSKAKMITRK